ELPTEPPKKKRRWLLLLLLLFIGLGIASGFSYYYWLAVPSVPIAQEHTAPSPSIESPKTTVVDNPTSHSSKIAETPTTAATTKTTTKTTTTTTRIVAPTANTAPPPPPPSGKDVFDRSNKRSGSQNAQVPIVTAQEAALTEIAEVNQENNVEQAVEKPNRAELAALRPVRTKDFKVHFDPLLKPVGEWWNEPQATIQFKGLALEGGIFTHAFQQMDGGTLRLLADFQFSTSKFGFSTGIGYRLNAKELTPKDNNFANAITNLVSNLESSDEESTSDPSSVFSNEQVNNLQETPRRSTIPSKEVAWRHELTVPLWLTYQPLSSLRLEAGPELGILLATATLEDEEADLFVDDTIESNEAMTFDLDQDGLTKLNRFSLQLGAGMTYYPTNRLGLRVQYQYLLTDPVQRPDIRYFELDRNSYQFSVLLNLR
ncbi:MAG: hypothetical protein AAF798_23035, partial [Bacteroidota bacterium]